MKEYGIENVRGGSYSQVNLAEDKLKFLRNEINFTSNNCFKCNITGHFINQCKFPRKKAQKPPPQKFSKKDVTCYRCSIKGHYANKCRVNLEKLFDKLTV